MGAHRRIGMIRVGFIGLGHNAIAHIEAHQQRGQIRGRRALRHQPGTVGGGARASASRARTSAEELCAQPDIEAVSINTGDQFHASRS